MKRNYEEPEMEVLLLEFADVMNQSPDFGNFD